MRIASIIDHRIIPAWAGNTPVDPFTDTLGPDHPRVGGEHYAQCDHCSMWTGSSPRGRGTLILPLAFDFPPRIIPAWAGNTLLNALWHDVEPDHPRVGGEHGGSKGA